MNAAQLIQIALGLFSTKAHKVQVEASDKKPHKVGYGDNLRSMYTQRQKAKLDAKRANA